MAEPAVVVQLDPERNHGSGWVDLPLWRRRVGYIRACRDQPTVAALIEGVGLGKTLTLELCLEAGDIDVLVTMHRLNATLERGTRAIYAGVGGHGMPRSASGQSLMFGIEEALAAMRRDDQVPVLGFDEAQFMTMGLLDICRYLYDRGLCSLVLAGNPRFNLTREGMEPLWRRIQHGYFMFVETAPQEDIDAFLDARRIAAPHARALLGDVAHGSGFAGIDDTIARARQLGGKAVPSLGDLEAALRTMPFLTAPAAPAPARRRNA